MPRPTTGQETKLESIETTLLRIDECHRCLRIVRVRLGGLLRGMRYSDQINPILAELARIEAALDAEWEDAAERLEVARGEIVANGNREEQQ